MGIKHIRGILLTGPYGIGKKVISRKFLAEITGKAPIYLDGRKAESLDSGNSFSFFHWATRLLKPDAGLSVVIIDHFEQIFSLDSDHEIRRI